MRMEYMVCVNHELSEEQTMPRAYDRNDVQAMLRIPNTRCSSGIRNRAILETLWQAGLRLQELVDLRPADLDLEQGRLYVTHGKGDKSRHVYFEPSLEAPLQRWLEIRPRSPWLFCTLQGEKLEPRYIQAMVDRVARKAGVQAKVDELDSGRDRWLWHPHALRHACSQEWQRQGKPLRVIQKQLGHARVDTTQRYTEVSDDEVQGYFRDRDAADQTVTMSEKQLQRLVDAAVRKALKQQSRDA